jgi:hypothetical protein
MGVMAAKEPRRCLTPKNIEGNLKRFHDERQPNSRNASFDYCYNYFRSHHEQGHVDEIATNMELSCLHLGFYLASWGMLRGSTDLLQRSIKHLERLINAIAEARPEMWTIDSNSYSDDAWDILDEFARQIRATLDPDSVSEILVTKIMLGVFGSVPAFDGYFKKGSGLSTYSRGQLKRVEGFYRDHVDVIERHRWPTLSFATGTDTQWTYTRAKVIDMIFFQEGLDQESLARRERAAEHKRRAVPVDEA